MNAMKESGLYNAAKEIRLGVLVPYNNQIDMTLLNQEFTDAERGSKFEIFKRDCKGISNENDPKYRIICEGRPEEFERPTLLHMRKSAESDHPETRYFYCHTKGVSWFGTPTEPFVMDWIKLLIYWNIERWVNAEDIVYKYDTYGCNYHNTGQHPPHYSGNFFWTNTHHLKTLPDKIGPMYNDPEFWLCSAGMFNGRPNVYNAFSSNLEGIGHYDTLFPESLYKT
jgi:hypothetical protein